MIWVKILSVPGGHRYFRAEDARIAVADDSGPTPDQTDDGICWVDTTRKIGLDLKSGSFLVPIILDRVSGRSYTSEPITAAAAVVETTNLAVQVTGSETEILFARALNGLRT